MNLIFKSTGILWTVQAGHPCCKIADLVQKRLLTHCSARHFREPYPVPRAPILLWSHTIARCNHFSPRLSGKKYLDYFSAIWWAKTEFYFFNRKSYNSFKVWLFCLASRRLKLAQNQRNSFNEKSLYSRCAADSERKLMALRWKEKKHTSDSLQDWNDRMSNIEFCLDAMASFHLLRLLMDWCWLFLPSQPTPMPNSRHQVT